MGRGNIKNRYCPMFSISSPTICDDCGSELYVNSHYTRFKKKLEVLFGRELSQKEWNKMRYKSIYVVATKEKVILDFKITKYSPKYEDLVSLITRIKIRARFQYG
jgi:hypothetical protein